MSTALHSKHMRPASHMMPSPQRSSFDVIKWFIPLATSMPITLILEWFTLYGAPASDPMDITQWSLDRTGILYILVLFVSELILLFKLGRSFAHIGHFLVDNKGKNGLRLLLELAVAAIAAIGVWVAMQTLGGLMPHWSWRFSLMACIAVVAIGLAIVHWKTIKKSLEWGFLILALAFGTLFVFAVPATTHVSWDDAIHYNSSVALSYVVDAQYTAADLEASIYTNKIEPVAKGVDNAPSDNPFKVDDAQIEQIRNLYNETNANNTKVSTIRGTKNASGTDTLNGTLVGRVPNAVGLWLGRVFFDDFTSIFVTGKIVSLVAYALTLFLGIRHLKSGKAIVGMVGLIPSALFLATNYSYDAFPLALIAFAFCRYIGDLQDKQRKIDVRSLALILIPFALGAATKLIYMPLAVVFLFAPRGKFSPHRLRQVFIIVSVAVVLVTVVVLAIQVAGSVTGRGRSLSDLRGGVGVNSPEQIAFILQDPLRFLGILFSYFVRFFNPILYAQPISSDEANRFTYWYYVRPSNATAGEYYTIYSLLTLTWIVVVILIALIDRDRVRDSYYDRALLKIMTAVGCLVVFFSACSALYISFTAVGSKSIAGMQNRYAYPLYVPALLIILNTKFGRSKNLGTNAHLYIGAATILLVIEVLYVFVWRF